MTGEVLQCLFTRAEDMSNTITNAQFCLSHSLRNTDLHLPPTTKLPIKHQVQEQKTILHFTKKPAS